MKDRPDLVEGCEHLGPFGSVQHLRPCTKTTPLMAQIALCGLKGLTIADNKLYRAPIFYHNLKDKSLEKDHEPPKFFFCSL